MIRVGEADFDIDFLDADVMERFEKAAKDIAEKTKGITSKPGLTNATYLRTFCELTESFLDEVLGEGSSTIIFQGRVNFMEHMEAYNDLFNAEKESMNNVVEFQRSLEQQYGPNRAQRRAAAKSKS